MITADITIDSTINDVGALFQKQLLIGANNKKWLIAKYEALKIKIIASDRVLKTAQNAVTDLEKNKLIGGSLKSKLIAAAKIALERAAKDRRALIVKELTQINDKLAEFMRKKLLKQLGYDILKMDNEYLINNYK